MDQLWEGGGELYFTNLRSVKLFANKIRYSLHLIGKEINFADFLRLELIRNIHPQLYETIYSSGKYFYDAEMAFEHWGKQIAPLDPKKEQQVRSEFYDALKKTVPAERRYVFSLLAELFPSFHEYERKYSRFGGSDASVENAERERRIFHPRYFRQYFSFRVPAELFSEDRYSGFRSSLKDSTEQKALTKFSEEFNSLSVEEFKRWHFMHLIDTRQNDFSIEASKGLSRGMARGASYWSRDAFEFDIGIRFTYQTLLRIKDSSERQGLLHAVIDDSTSALYSLHLIRVIETNKDSDPPVVADVVAVKSYLQERVEREYLGPAAPSIYDTFKDIDANLFLFDWARLGPAAASNAWKYVYGLLRRNPTALNQFLKLLFRVDFIDDYEQLKPLFDYDEISKLITENEEKLDQEKVRKFKERHGREKSSSASG